MSPNRELDTELVFDAGKAAFNRIWFLTPITSSGQARHIGTRSFRPSVVKTGFSSIPGGPGGSAGTLGGTGTAVSAHSAHRKEAIELLRFQLHALMQANDTDGGPMQTEFSGAPSISGSGASPVASNASETIVARPSVAAASKYKEVSRAYIDTVHSVLTGEKRAPAAAAALEKQLIEITGFRGGPPKADKIVAGTADERAR